MTGKVNDICQFGRRECLLKSCVLSASVTAPNYIILIAAVKYHQYLDFNLLNNNNLNIIKC
jgi:hypothetical protein